jgi:hypothetical protein
MDKISSLWPIDRDHQQLFHNGARVRKLNATVRSLFQPEDSIVVVSKKYEMLSMLNKIHNLFFIFETHNGAGLGVLSGTE